jgi:ATP-dependent RNA helicase DHX8/PRP22
VQYLADAGYTRSGKSIVCTQPRKVAAMALTERVREESDGCFQSPNPVGSVTSTSQQTRWADINFATDYVLLQLCLVDPSLSKFSCVVVDEAHERSLNTDLLLALLKRCVSKRPDLKIVIMSATADAHSLSSYFGSGEVLYIPGRKFPVQIVYEPEILADGWKTSEKDESAYVRKVTKKVRAIHERDKDGTILAFLTSPADVDWACQQDFGTSAWVLPFYGKLPNEDLQKVFQVRMIVYNLLEFRMRS